MLVTELISVLVQVPHLIADRSTDPMQSSPRWFLRFFQSLMSCDPGTRDSVGHDKGGGGGEADDSGQRNGKLPSAHLILHEPGRVIQDHVLSLWRGVPGGQGQAAQGVPASAPLLDHRHDLLLHWPCQGHPCGANSHVVTAVDDPLRGTLGGQNGIQR